MNLVLKNLTQLEQAIGRESILELLQIFYQQMDESVPELVELIIDNEFDQVSRLAHKLKSSCRGVGAETLGAYFEMLEHNPGVASYTETKKYIENLLSEFRILVKEWDGS